MKLTRFDVNPKKTNKKPIILFALLISSFLVGLLVFASYTNFKMTTSYNILKGEVSKFNQENLTLAVKLVDEEENEVYAEDFPDASEYFYDKETSFCENGAVLSYVDGKASVSKISGKEKCVLYFKKYGALASSIINNAKTNNYFNTTEAAYETVTSDGEFGLYSAKDDLGTSYYFRGDAENNYVQFGTWSESKGTVYLAAYHEYVNGPLLYYDGLEYATLAECESSDSVLNAGFVCEEKNYSQSGADMYWRIVRINGDGTIRMIYDGTEKKRNGEVRGASIAYTQFGVSGDYTYLENETMKDSIIKSELDEWYTNNLEKTYGKYIADAIFCNDREVTSSEEENDYIIFDNVSRISLAQPRITCPVADRYTVTNSIGNRLMSQPIGLITADEVMMAGVLEDYNNYTNYYLYSGEPYWTITPADMYPDFKAHYSVFASGSLMSGEFDISAGAGVRPVINLKADVSFTGDGSYATPYVISN